MLPPQQSLHSDRRRLWTQMLPPPQSLQRDRTRLWTHADASAAAVLAAGPHAAVDADAARLGFTSTAGLGRMSAVCAFVECTAGVVGATQQSTPFYLSNAHCALATRPLFYALKSSLIARDFREARRERKEKEKGGWGLLEFMYFHCADADYTRD